MADILSNSTRYAADLELNYLFRNTGISNSGNSNSGNSNSEIDNSGIITAYNAPCHSPITPPSVFHISCHACFTVFKNFDANEVKI